MAKWMSLWEGLWGLWGLGLGTGEVEVVITEAGVDIWATLGRDPPYLRHDTWDGVDTGHDLPEVRMVVRKTRSQVARHHHSRGSLARHHVRHCARSIVPLHLPHVLHDSLELRGALRLLLVEHCDPVLEFARGVPSHLLQLTSHLCWE